jgi:phage I-like protein
MISENDSWIELVPAGTFCTNDGRGPFHNDNPREICSLSAQLLQGGVPIDFDHAIDRGAPQGRPAPAAGWVREFRVVAGAIQGRVEWTPRGLAAVKAKDYRFISPVFSFVPPEGASEGAMTGRVLVIQRAALTNNPALDQLPAIAASRTELSPLAKSICAQLNIPEREFVGAQARRGIVTTSIAAAIPRQCPDSDAAIVKTLNSAVEGMLRPVLRELGQMSARM